MPPDLFDTGYNSSTQYADGHVSNGKIVLANVTLGSYTVHNQAIMVAPGKSPLPSEINGLIGLSMTTAADIHDALVNSSYATNGEVLLGNIFSHMPDQPNYFTFLMDRGEVGVTDGGVLTISELVTEYAAVTSAPKLAVMGPFGWTVLMDGMDVNGEHVVADTELNSSLAEEVFGLAVPKGKTVATIDSGTSFITGPQAFVDAAYKNVPGAFLTNDTNGAGLGYSVPCDTKLNLTFYFAGQPYPMHPIDAIVVNLTETGVANCVGALTVNPNPNGALTDWLIGDSFMRNIYTLYDYGNQTDPKDGLPYIQMLSILDPNAAWAETDVLMLKRLVAYERFFTSTYASPTTQLSYTGLTSSIAVTSADNKQTFAPFSTATSAGAAPTGFHKISCAVAEDAAVASSSGGRDVDVDGLTRNSYIVIGLLAAVLILLIALAALAIRTSKANKGYRAIPAMTGGAPPRFVDPYES
ncbi:acid protease [Trametes coccinea BRFM310]|uniref:Acid protease n=1 Tax=Trametes coccinea (strain BRFM310) TaxID=1353009 RepID=A0A1Y2IQA9_TRAC3|nr:acid protease [Trametes coccinea BRFM310]